MGSALFPKLAECVRRGPALGLTFLQLFAPAFRGRFRSQFIPEAAKCVPAWTTCLASDQNGAVMIEFAIVFPLIVVVMLAMASLAATIDLAQQVAVGAGLASRYLASAATDQGVSDRTSRVARCLAMTGHPGTRSADCDLSADCAIQSWCGEQAAQGIVIQLSGDASLGIISLRVYTSHGGRGTAAASAALFPGLPVRGRVEYLRAGT